MAAASGVVPVEPQSCIGGEYRPNLACRPCRAWQVADAALLDAAERVARMQARIDLDGVRPCWKQAPPVPDSYPVPIP